MPRPQDSNWSAPRPRTPAPQIDPVPLWPTPEKRDLLFYVEKNGDLKPNQQWQYGDGYSDRIKYPNHKLVFVSPQSPDSWSKWYYASDRIEEDEYNWSYTEADIGGTKFQAVAREYIVPRKDWEQATPAMGTAMADVPKDKFAGAFVLAERQQIKVEDEVLSSLYVFERRVYVKKVTLIENGYNEELEMNLSTTQTLRYRGEVVSGTAIETLVADEDNAYWGLTTTTARSAQQLSENWFLVIEKKLSVRRSTSDTYSDAWPLKQTKVKGSDSDVPNIFADQVSIIETTTKEDLPAANVDNIPAPAEPVGTQSRIKHEKLSDLHYNKAILEHQFSLSNAYLSTDIEVRPYVKITTRTIGGLSPVVPGTGVGSSTLVWRGGEQSLYRNSDQDSEARTGLKSIETSDQQWGSFTERTDYTTSSEPPEGGSTRLIFDDGETKVYEVSVIQSIDANGTTKDKDPQPWGFITWDGLYSLTEDPGADRSKQIWRRGSSKVFLNETLTTDVSGTTVDKDPQSWGTLTWNGQYATTQDSGAERSRQVWRIGDDYVFLNESIAVEISGATKDIDPQQWGTLTWSGLYSDTASGDRSRQVWRMGQYTVFLNETLSVEVEGTTKDLDPQTWGNLIWGGTYGTSPSGDRYRQVWKLKGNTVYLNETCSIQISGETVDKDPQPWGFAKWTGTYSDAVGLDADRTRQVWRLGEKTVYLNETVAAEVSGGTVDKDPQPWGTVQWDGTYAKSITDGDRNRQVWRVGDEYVYLNEIATLSIDGTTLDKDLREWGELHWTGTYSDTTSGDRSRQVYNLHGKRVYLNEDVSVKNVGGTNKDILPQEWGSLTWSGTYQTVPDEAPGHRSRQVFRVKNFTVFLNEEPSQQINTAEFVSAREENSLLTETQYSTYGTASNSGTNTRSRVVFALGNDRVYENIRIERTALPPRNYNGLASSVDLPPILRGINAGAFTRRDGDDEYWFQPNLSYGYRGSLPCKVTEYWSDTPEAAANVVVMKPEPVVFSFPGGGFSVPPSLHDSINFQVNIGTDHPVYEQQVHTITIPATSPASWEGQELLVDVDAQPYREGYVIREYRIQT